MRSNWYRFSSTLLLANCCGYISSNVRWSFASPGSFGISGRNEAAIHPVQLGILLMPQAELVSRVTDGVSKNIAFRFFPKAWEACQNVKMPSFYEIRANWPSWCWQRQQRTSGFSLSRFSGDRPLKPVWFHWRSRTDQHVPLVLRLFPPSFFKINRITNALLFFRPGLFVSTPEYMFDQIEIFFSSSAQFLLRWCFVFSKNLFAI